MSEKKWHSPLHHKWVRFLISHYDWGENETRCPQRRKWIKYENYLKTKFSKAPGSTLFIHKQEKELRWLFKTPSSLILSLSDLTLSTAPRATGWTQGPASSGGHVAAMVRLPPWLLVSLSLGEAKHRQLGGHSRRPVGKHRDPPMASISVLERGPPQADPLAP